MAGNLPENTDYNLDSPSEFEFFERKFWKEDITNNDFLRLYTRKGIVARTINKQVELMFKKGWSSSNKQALEISKENNFNSYARFSYLNALISGFCLIYVNYGDTSDYNQQPPQNVKAISYYVIPRAWVFRDIYYNQQVYETYEIYRADGTTFEVHKDRFIRVRANKLEISKILPAFDSLTVLDNIMWGMGQTMFRSGSGFPVLKIKDAAKIMTLPDGTKKTRMGYYKDMGFLRDMNTQVGFMHDQQDEFGFEGAEGKAIKPGEYYDKTFQQCAVDLEVPVDILKGLAAGAITGSETNLKIYYGDLAAKQIEQLEIIFNDLFATQGVSNVDYKWNPIFEQTQSEIIDNLSKDIETIYKLELYGYSTHEMNTNYLAKNYPVLNFDEQKINAIKNLPLYIKPAGLSFSQDNNRKIKISNTNDSELSAMSKKVQAIEKSYSKEMNKAFRDTSKRISSLLVAFNTDSVEAD